MYTKTFMNFVSPITYSLIMAVDSRGGIGLNNDLPWKGIVDNKSDMQWFKDKTKGKIIVMGYNTWVSIGSKPLPGRVNVVITAKHGNQVRADMDAFNKDCALAGKKAPTVLLAPSPKHAVDAIAAVVGVGHQGGEVMVIGGAKIYEAFMEWTSRIYLTTFDGEFEADTFVNLSLDFWELRYRDTMELFEPKFEIWDCTEGAAQRPDSSVIQISHKYLPASAEIIDLVKRIEENKADVPDPA